MPNDRPHHLEPSTQTARVILVYKDFAGFKGLSHVGLGISAFCTAKTLRRAGIWAEVWPCPSAEDLRARLASAFAQARANGEIPPTHVIISAPWIATQEINAMAVAHPEVLFAVVSHSNVAFLAADPHGIRLLRECSDLQHVTHNVRVGGVTEKFTDWATVAWRTDAAWLPNLYDLSEAVTPQRRQWGGGTLRIGLFGANRVLKNATTAAAAAAELAMTLRVPTELHVSQENCDGAQTNVLAELVGTVPNLKLVRAGWLPWPEFRRLVRQMDLMLQPSFTESFNVVTADGIAEGVPSVVSDAIDWAPRRWKAVADEPRDVAKVALHLLHDPDAARDGRRELDKYVTAGVTRWKQFLLEPRNGPPRSPLL
jgi:hypothetical protein